MINRKTLKNGQRKKLRRSYSKERKIWKKIEGKRRDYKLTLSRALSDSDVERQRSFASVKEQEKSKLRKRR